MLGTYLRIVTKLIVGGMTIIVVVPLLLFGALWVKSAYDNWTYAAAVFGGVVAYDDNLASRKWHPLGSGGWDCSYAVVSLADTAALSPPTSPDAGRWDARFAGDAWRPTPAETLGDTTRDALEACSAYFSESVSRRLSIALAQPDSWFWRDGVGETLAIYSPAQRIAARIRFGD